MKKLILFIKNFIIANYNSKNNKINDVGNNKYLLLHEKGHRNNRKIYLMKVLFNNQKYLFLFTILYLCLNNNGLALLFFSLYIFIDLLDEFLAWLYCFRYY